MIIDEEIKKSDPELYKKYKEYGFTAHRGAAGTFLDHPEIGVVTIKLFKALVNTFEK